MRYLFGVAAIMLIVMGVANAQPYNHDQYERHEYHSWRHPVTSTQRFWHEHRLSRHYHHDYDQHHDYDRRDYK